MDQEIKLRSSALGQISRYDFFGLSPGNFKVFLGSLMGRHCSPHLRSGAQPVHYNFLERAAAENLCTSGLSMFICISVFLVEVPLLRLPY